ARRFVSRKRSRQRSTMPRSRMPTICVRSSSASLPQLEILLPEGFENETLAVDRFFDCVRMFHDIASRCGRGHPGVRQGDDEQEDSSQGGAERASGGGNDG